MAVMGGNSSRGFLGHHHTRQTLIRMKLRMEADEAEANEREILALPFDLDSFDDPYLPDEIEPYQDTTFFDYY